MIELRRLEAVPESQKEEFHRLQENDLDLICLDHFFLDGKSAMK